jgi:hypothetical protein
MRMVDDLPAPFGPRKPNASPRRTWTSIPSTATKSPKVLRRSHASMSTSEEVTAVASRPVALPDGVLDDRC